MSLNSRYVSIKLVIDKLIRDNKYDNEVDFEEALEWSYEALAKIKRPESLIETFCTLTVVGHKAELPCDLFRLIGLREATTNMPLIWASDIFNKHRNCIDDAMDICNDSLEYTQNDNYLFFNFEEGEVEIAYYGFPVDEDGYLKIPDEDAYIEAVSKYLRYMIDYRMWRSDRLSDKVYNKSEQDWLWYIAQAKNAGKMPSIDQMESLKRQYIRLVPVYNRHNASFKNLNKSEQRFTKNSLNSNNNALDI